MNNITVAGTLGRDIEIRTMPNGDPVGNFSVADSQGKDKPTIWWNVQLFGKRAQALAPYLLKGQQVAVSGSITEREWTNKEGVKQKTMEIRAADIALQGGKRGGADDGGQALYQAPRPAQQQYGKPAPQQQPAASGFNTDDSDIPF